MRFNDVMQTVLASSQRSGLAAITLWRQCVDILAQYDRAGAARIGDAERDLVIERLQALQPELNEAQRISAVVELGSRLRSPALVAFFASDRPSVCVAAMSRARLPDDVWVDVIPRLTPVARGVLRGRRDMGEGARLTLEQYGKTDLLLTDQAEVAEEMPMLLTPVMEVEPEAAPQPTPVEANDVPANAIAANATAANATAANDSVETGGQMPVDRSQIRELVDRIEKFTNSASRALGGAMSMGTRRLEPLEESAPRRFTFETDSNGMLVWVGDASRASLVGLSIADPAQPGATGADGNIAGAFSRRSSFQHGRFWIGDGPYAGEWRLSATPFFDQQTGRFQGYRGQARRPMVHEVPYSVPAEPQQRFGGITVDSMRQLIHELRTPLNAILGFAEIIEQQLFGPAEPHYREMASHIMADARRLLSAFEELDLAARSNAAQAAQDDDQSESVDLAELVEDVVAAFNGVTLSEQDRRAPARITFAVGLPQVRLDPVQGERMFQHLLRTLMSVSEPDESLKGAAWFQPDNSGGHVLIGFDRPSRLKGLDEAQLLNPGYGTDGDWPDAPLLGLGFSLRLIRSLASAQGGSMLVEGDRIMIALPAAAIVASGEEAAHP